MTFGVGYFSTNETLSASDSVNHDNNTGTAPGGVHSGTLTVTYLYNGPLTDVPEPFTMTLMGSGLALLGLIGRKRFAR